MSASRGRWNLFVYGWAGLAILLATLSPDVQVSRATSAAAQQDNPWIAPADARVVKNSVKVTPDGLKEAGELFQQICSSCHGPKGAGDGALAKALTPKPANFTDVRRMSKETDVTLFWKLTNGRGPMPSWQQIPEKQRWELVNYIRTLAPKGGSPGKSNSATK